MRFIKPWYAERGRATHKAIHLEILGTLDQSTVDSVVLPYLNSWRRWRDRYKPCFMDTEKIVHLETLDYAGIADAFIDYSPYDWKSGKKTPAHILQLTAYNMAYNMETHLDFPMYGVYLNCDGSEAKQYEFKIEAQAKAANDFIDLCTRFHDAQYDEDFKRHMEAAINGV